MIRTHKTYYPTYVNKDKLIILITGGRTSGKPCFVSSFLRRLIFEVTPVDKIVHQILYTRYTVVPTNISVIPGFLEKAELDGTQRYFRSIRSDMANRATGSTVIFRGLKTSSGNQTAKLESIHDITTFVVDETEEWVSEKEFETIMLSIYQKDIQNRIFIIMNPTGNNHWAYKRFIESTHKEVMYDGIPVQMSTRPNMLHIHTTHLGNLEDLSQGFISEVGGVKASNPEKYVHTVMSRQVGAAEDAVFKHIGVVKEFPKQCKRMAIGLDLGYINDVSAAMICGAIDDNLYVDELFYWTNMLSSDSIKALHRYEMKVFLDSADPRPVQEVHNGGIKVYPVEEGAGLIIARIDRIESPNIFVTERSYNLRKGFPNYVRDKDRDGNYINQPIDVWNHGIDATRYWILTAPLGRI